MMRWLARSLSKSGPLAIRAVLVLAVAAVWEILSRSGLFYRDVIPPLLTVAHAIWALVASADFYWHVAVTGAELVVGLPVGAVAGLVIGVALGANRYLSDAFENFLYYLGPTPKIIFFPVLIMWFGVGLGSKMAMATISSFFPVVLSVAAGMRTISPTMVKVGRSFRLSRWQMAVKVYVPAMRQPIVNGLRLGLGVALVGTLLAETKLSKAGLGFLVVQAYSVFDMPRMYALLVVVFVIAILLNQIGPSDRRGNFR